MAPLNGKLKKRIWRSHHSDKMPVDDIARAVRQDVQIVQKYIADRTQSKRANRLALKRKARARKALAGNLIPAAPALPRIDRDAVAYAVDSNFGRFGRRPFISKGNAVAVRILIRVNTVDEIAYRLFLSAETIQLFIERDKTCQRVRTGEALERKLYTFLTKAQRREVRENIAQKSPAELAKELSLLEECVWDYFQHVETHRINAKTWRPKHSWETELFDSDLFIGSNTQRKRHYHQWLIERRRERREHEAEDDEEEDVYEEQDDEDEEVDELDDWEDEEPDDEDLDDEDSDDEDLDDETSDCSDEERWEKEARNRQADEADRKARERDAYWDGVVKGRESYKPPDPYVNPNPPSR